MRTSSPGLWLRIESHAGLILNPSTWQKPLDPWALQLATPLAQPCPRMLAAAVYQAPCPSVAELGSLPNTPQSVCPEETMGTGVGGTEMAGSQDHPP